MTKDVTHTNDNIAKRIDLHQPLTKPDMYKYRLTITDVMAITSLSRGQIYTLEKQGMFPPRIATTSTRSAWSSEDIKNWMQQRLDARQAPPAPFHLDAISLKDRFIRTKDVHRLAPMHWQTYHARERNGQFPKRLILGKGRHAWVEREIIMWFEHLRN